MLAILETGSKQYHVKVGDIIKIERLEADLDDIVTFDKVLALYGAKKEKLARIGTPYIKNTIIKAKVLKQERGGKIVVFKKKRRQNYKRKKGHRQNSTILEITRIEEK